MRREFEMSEADFKELLDACKPVPCMMIGSYATPSPQENANRAWARLGRKMGFIGDTAKPISGKGTRFFTAEEAKAEIEKEAR